MNYYEKPIREWVAEDRPREKMMEKGIFALTDAELLATLLASGTPKLSAIGLARLLLERFGGLRNLSRASMAELMAVNGIGQAKASSIVAGFELARRKLATDHQQVHFMHSGDIARYLIPKIGDLRNEVFYVVSLDRANNVIAEAEVHRGGVSSVTVDARLVFKEAINKLASSVVVCHNHPSGSIRPSKSDDELTAHLVAAGKVLEMRVLDHLIIARQNWYSYADNGRIRQMEIDAGYKGDSPNEGGFIIREALSA
ncbi:MAG TPA: DNA repair protein RadC [Bacteroidia bacterium]|nr:DNA repair protein RadC [Bacteroidia bacterium]